MKPILLLSAAALLMTSACKNLPPFENLSSNFVVVTKYDTSVDFTTYKTFSIRDTITVITGDPRDSVWYDANAQSIIAEVVKNMKAAGYTEAPTHQTADLAVQLIGIRNTTIYAVPPGYWWGYPGWAPPCYWGYCGGYGYWYPYWFTYSVNTGSIVCEIADLKNANKLGKINILWDGIGSGQIGSSTSFIVNQCLLTVDQAFQQSPYLKAN